MGSQAGRLHGKHFRVAELKAAFMHLALGGAKDVSRVNTAAPARSRFGNVLTSFFLSFVQAMEMC